MSGKVLVYLLTCYRKEAANIHIYVADSIIDYVKQSGRKCSVVPDYLLKPEHLEDVDLVCSLGGDGTFLKTSSVIKNPNLPIIGINTDPARSVGHLCNRRVYHDHKE
jgi:NAD+ kinase